MFSKTEFITDNRAAQLLGTIGKRRSLSKKLAEAYAADMVSGEWPLTPQGLVIRLISGQDKPDDEQLEDGWHRCWAVRLAAMQLKTPGFGVLMTATYLEPGDPDIIQVLDTGRSRTFADLLKMDGRQDYSQLATITRRVWDWDSNQAWMRISQPTRKQLYDVLHADEAELVEAARFAHGWNNPQVVSGNTAAFSRFLFRNRVVVKTKNGYVESKEDTSEDAEWFIRHLGNGADLPEDHPLFALRFWRMQGAGTMTPRGKSHNTLLLAVVRTWNTYRAGDPAKRYGPPKIPVTNENFPRPM